MDNSKEIIDYLESHKELGENEIINAYRTIGESKDKTAIPYLLQALKGFEQISWKVRNAIAISLGDLGADEAVPFLMEVVNNEMYWGQNGSFLYALTIKPLNSIEYFLDFVKLTTNDSLEIRSAAIELVEHWHNKISTEVRKDALAILANKKTILESNNIGQEQYGVLGYIEHAKMLLLNSE